jgi:hypothetical protein
MAPPLPFAYLGRLVQGEEQILFLRQQNQALAARVGEELAGAYRLQSASETALEFVYLPLDTRQTLAIAPR